MGAPVRNHGRGSRSHPPGRARWVLETCGLTEGSTPAAYEFMEQVVSLAERHRPLLDELIATVGEHNPDVDRDLLEQAFELACEAHEGHKRQSGEDFIVHPAGVARILAELRRPSPAIAAGLLHDVVEDTDITIEQVRADFGEDIARLVEGASPSSRGSRSRAGSRRRPRTTAR